MLFLAIGVFGGSVAAVCALLIFYEEYERHGLGRRRLWQASLQGALVTFVFFVVLSILAGCWIYF